MIKQYIQKIIKSPPFLNCLILFLFVLLIEFGRELLLNLNTGLNFDTKNYLKILFYPIPFVIIPLIIPRISRIYSILLVAIFSISAFMYFSHIIIYGSDLVSSTYYAIWETNIQEATDYFKDYFNVISISLILTLVLIGIITIKLVKTGESKLTIHLIALFLSLAFISFFSKTYSNTIPIKFIRNFIQYKSEIKDFKSQIEIRKTNNFKDLNPIYCADSLAKTIVVVIGESASIYHQGIYGYKRQTNPLLTEIKDELFVYKNVIAPHSHTNPALSKILTFANFESMDPLYQNRSIIEYMNDAGFYTYWLSNQQFANKYTTISSSIGIQSDYFIFTHSNKDADEHSYDGKLLKPLKKALKSSHGRKFIVLHLMGSHSGKDDRFPIEFKKFNATDDLPNEPYISDWYKYQINSHDNSVLYNDWFLRECIELLRSEEPNSALLYFADHGEEMFEYRNFFGHGEGNASIFMFDIPFILWLSDDFKQQNQDKVNHFNKQLDRKYQTDNIIHSIIDLANCYSNDFDKSKSIFNQDFTFRKRIIGNFDYDELIKTKKSITD